MKLFKKTSIVAILLMAVAIFVYISTLRSETLYNQASVVAHGEVVKKVEKKVKHIDTPEPLKAVYMSQCAAATPSYRKHLISLIDETELNAIVVDVKDYTGTVAIDVEGGMVEDLLGEGCRVKDMQEFVSLLHDKGIYVIARVTVFQDPNFTSAYPEYAVKRKSDGGVWRDRKGLAFVDVGAKPFWDYIATIAEASYKIGFDEINFDYIRYPSDGNMTDIYFSHSGTSTKRAMLKEFFEYIDDKMKDVGVVTSADIFGMTTTSTDDLNIGQILEYALLSFDYVSPMVYPSHYPPQFNGWPDPNKVPYDIIHFTMKSALDRSDFLYAEIATSTPNAKVLKRIKPTQLRPWIQDFDYPVPYTADMVRAQIQATYDVGLTSWMLWDPSNKYTREALLKEN